MATNNPHNVYSGPDSVRNYFDPDFQPPLPLVELPEHLNPFYQDGVRIYAKMMTMHPANNVKAMPAMNLLEKGVKQDSTKTIIEYSSGSTVISMSLVARALHGISDTRAFLSNKTSETKLRLMQFFGLNITLFGGPSQPEPLDMRGGIQRARTMAMDSDDIINPNQYENDNNWRSHIRWTGPQLFRQLPEINLICAGMGTSGTMTGLGTYFKGAKPSVTRLAVCTAPGDRVPGPRSYALLRPVEFPWKEAVDAVEEVGSLDSYSLSLALCREGLLCGPSSGFNLQGLYQYLEKRKLEGTLDELAGEDGSIHSVFLCCDLPYQYLGEYFDKLPQESFHPIQNEHLTKVDLFRYDEAWEKYPSEAIEDFYGSFDAILNPFAAPQGITTTILDLRQPIDFNTLRLPSSSNFPLNSLSPDTPSPFFDPATLEKQWVELEDLFKQAYITDSLRGNKVLIVCYDGDTSRVATSVLRAKSIEAYCIRGGCRALLQSLPALQTSKSSRRDSATVAEEKSAVSVAVQEVADGA